MKTTLKVLAVTVAAALTLTTAPTTARAEHDDWNKFAAVLTGIAAVGTIIAVASHDDARAHVRIERCAPPPPPPQHWVPGHYEVRRETICIPGRWDTIVTPAEYGWVKHGCHKRYVLIKPECVRRVWVLERTEWREARVWVPGQYATAGHYARAY